MMGLPLSGKDTYIKQHFSDMPIISLDDIRQEFSISPTQDNSKVITEGLTLKSASDKRAKWRRETVFAALRKATSVFSL